MKTTKYILLGLLGFFLYTVGKNTTIKINVSYNDSDSLFTSTDNTFKPDTINIIELDSSSNHKPTSSLNYDSYNIEYVDNSRQIPISDEMMLTDKEEFKRYEQAYKEEISLRFSPKQVKSIKEIIISDSKAFDSGDGATSAGLCSTLFYGNRTSSSILIASKNEDHFYNLLHECCHALYYDNYNLFERKYKARWNQLDDQFVTRYASTDIVEDFAETGAFYLSGKVPMECYEKVKLFEEFYKETK